MPYFKKKFSTVRKLYSMAILFAVLLAVHGCNNDDDDNFQDTSELSWFPLEIGNYWRKDDQNFSEIVDTLTIRGDLYYEIFSLIGGDVVSTRFYRIDENQNLIQRLPTSGTIVLRAKFDAEVGNTFYTLGNQTINDFRATVIQETDTLKVFEFQRVYHPRLTDKHEHTYIKGKGWWFDWKEVKIGDKIYYF